MLSSRTVAGVHHSSVMSYSVIQNQKVFSRLCGTVTSGRFADHAEVNSSTAVYGPSCTAAHSATSTDIENKINARNKENHKLVENVGIQMQHQSEDQGERCTFTKRTHRKRNTDSGNDAQRHSHIKSGRPWKVSPVMSHKKMASSVMSLCWSNLLHRPPLMTKTMHNRGIWDIFKR